MPHRRAFTFVFPVAISLLVTGMIWGITVYELKEIHAKAVTAENLKNAANARAYEEQILRAIETLDQSLLVLRHNHAVQRQRGDINELLRAMQINRKFIGNVTLVDSTGHVLASTAQGLNQNFADRDYFKFHAAHPEDTLRISAPILGRHTGKWLVPFTRRLNTPDGSFGGVVFMAVDPVYLAASAEQVPAGLGGSMAVIGLDGITRARNNNGKISFGENVSSSQLFKEIPKGDVGQYQARAASDGVLRTASYRVLDTYPLVVVSASSLDAIDASLRSEQILYLSFAAVGTVLFLSFVAVTGAALRQGRRDLEKLRQSREKLRAIVDASPTPMALNDGALNITYLNRAFVSTYGYTLADIPTVAHWWPLAYPDPQYREEVATHWVNELQRSDSAGVPFEPKELRVRCKNGKDKYVMATAAPLLGGFRSEHVVTLHDITGVRETQNALTALVGEKNALLREVHHRVKNNLQVITSLLRLESGRSADADTRSVLDAMQGRIRSMALMHESLYQSDSIAAIELSYYLRQLATQAMRALSAHGASVQLDLQLETIWVNMDQATSCGLLVNELMANAFKYAFTGGRSGRIALGLHQGTVPNQVVLEVQDDGVGLPPDWESRSQNSLGLQLVDDLVRQLGGTLSIGPQPLARFTITFPRQSSQLTGPAPLTE